MTSHFKKIMLVVISLLSITNNISSQTNNRFEIVITNAYSNFIRSYDKPEGTFNGNYGYGAEFRYIVGRRDRIFKTEIGLAYSNVSQKRTVKGSQLYLWDFQEVTHYHLTSIPFYLVLDNNKWRGGLQISVECPFYRNTINRSMSPSGNLGIRERSGNRTRIFVHGGLGFGAFFGKTFQLKNRKSFFIEGQFNIFNLIRPLEAHDEYLMRNIFPYWIGLNIGKGF